MDFAETASIIVTAIDVTAEIIMNPLKLIKMKAIEFLKLLDRECLPWEYCEVVNGNLLAGEGYAHFFPVNKEPILRSYFKEHLTCFTFIGDNEECFVFLPEPALSMPSSARDNERIYIWILED